MRYQKFGWLAVVVLLVALLTVACGGGTPNSAADRAPAATTAPAAESATESSAPVSDTASTTTTTVTDAVTTTEGMTTSAETTTSAASGARTFTITQAGTQARFSIYELLMGQDKDVIGVTSLVEGSITVDPANPSGATISPIRIDASDLTTDSERRNGAIRRFVLQSNQEAYKYITFTPTAIEGLPAAVQVGESFSFMVKGDLTIRDVTNPETFELTVTANSATELVGLGKATILRANYDLTIPSVPSVANVAEEVELEIEFTAVASE